MIPAAAFFNRRIKVSIPMGELSFWLAAVGIPVAILIIGTLLRLYRSAPQTAATDIFSALIVFDGAVLLDSTHFEKFVSPLVQKDLAGLIFISVFISIIIWTFSILELEVKLLDCHVEGFAERPFLLVSMWLLVWLLCLALIVTHIALFTARIPI